MSRLTHAVVSLAVLDVRRRPEHRAELTSQLLLGEVVRVLGARAGGQWWRVEGLADGYRGWVRGWGLVRAPAARARSWQAKAAARVAVATVEARAGPGRGAAGEPAVPEQPGDRREETRSPPQGRVAGRAQGLGAGRGSGGAGTRSACSRSGSEACWGCPITGAGGRRSDWTARDSRRWCSPNRAWLFPGTRRTNSGPRARSEGEEPEAGRPVFFAAPGQPPGHVGIGLGGGYYAHCRGMVRISSAESSNPVVRQGTNASDDGLAETRATPASGLRRTRGRGEST